jgi:dihydrofolate reductase
MTEITATTFVSLDGVMQAPGGPNEDPREFPYGGWVVPYADAGMGEFVSTAFAKAGGFLLGRRTYEIFAAHWPRVTDPGDPVAKGLNTLPKYVVSNTLKSADWHNSTVISGDVLASLRKLKEQDGRELQIHGSGALIRSLLDEGIIDEFRIMVFPVYLGKGTRLFPQDGEPTAYRLTDSTTTVSGIAIHTLRPAGAARFGSFELPPE